MDRKILEQLAELSSFTFTDDEYMILAEEFDSTIAFIKPVLETRTSSKIDFGKNARTISNLRADEVRESLPIELTLQNAPNKRDRFFVVPQVVE